VSTIVRVHFLTLMNEDLLLCQAIDSQKYHQLLLPLSSRYTVESDERVYHLPVIALPTSSVNTYAHNFIFYFFSMKQTLRQIVAILALGGIALTLVPNALAAFTEVSAADKLATEGYIVTQATTAAYRLGDTLTRAEAMKVTGKGMGIVVEPVKTTGCTSRFTDVLAGTWECAIIEIAARS